MSCDRPPHLDEENIEGELNSTDDTLCRICLVYADPSCRMSRPSVRGYSIFEQRVGRALPDGRRNDSSACSPALESNRRANGPASSEKQRFDSKSALISRPKRLITLRELSCSPQQSLRRRIGSRGRESNGSDTMAEAPGGIRDSEFRRSPPSGCPSHFPSHTPTPVLGSSGRLTADPAPADPI